MKKIGYIFYLFLLSSGAALAQRTAPAAPTKLDAIAASSTRINLTWTDNATNETGFEVERSTDGKTFAKIADAAENITTYSNTGLTQNTKYYYRVRAINSIGNSAYTNVAEETTPSNAPNDPTNLVATAISASQINLSWKDNSDNEVYMEVQRSTDGRTFDDIARLDENVTTYQNTGLTANTKYYYRIRAYNKSGSGYSNIADATTLSAVPNAPNNLVATSVSTSQINLSWTNNSSNETDFEIERGTDGTNFAKITTVTANVTTYQNTGLSENTKYYYRLRAYNKAAGTYSDYSNIADATTQSNTVNAPSDLTLTPLLADNKNNVLLRWNDNSNDETGFEIESSTNGTTFSKATTTAANVTQYEIYLSTSTKNYFRVRAIKGAVTSDYTNVVDYDMGPESPLDLTATVVSSSQINLGWSDRSSDETGYEVERSTDGTNFGKIATLGANVVTYQNTGLTASTTYYYRVRGVKGSAGSAYTHIVNARTQDTPAPTPPTAPIIDGNLSQNWTKNSDRVSEITASWQDKSDNESSFEIQWGDTDQYSGGSASVDANMTQFKIEGSWPGCGHKVYVRVRAKNASGESSWSATTVTTSIAIPEAPNNVAATANSSSEIRLNWGGANESYSRESRFIIQYSTSSGFTSPSEVQSDQNTDTKTVNGLAANTTYYFRIKTQNCAGESDWSNTANAKTQESVTPAEPLSSPSDLTLTPLLADNKNNVLLRWNDNSNDETGFEIESSTNGTTFTKATTTAANVTQYEIYLSTSTKNYFRVRAIKGAVTSGYTNVVDYDMGPESPLDLTATVISSSQINLGWSDRSSDETGYEVERSTDGTNFGKIATLGANIVTYQNTGLTANTTYYYRVRGVKGSAGSAYTHIVNAKTSDVPAVPKPSAPTNLVATAISLSQINLTWNDAANNEEGFEIERSTDGTNWGNSVSVGANTVNYAATGLTANTKYYFRVRARNAGGTSDWSNVAEATTQPAKPVAPANLRLKTSTNANQISLEWDDLATDETAYELSRSADVNTAWEVLKGDLAPNTKTYDDRPVRSGRKYFYRVRTVRSGEFSDYSNVLETIAPVVSAVTIDDPVNWQVYPNPVIETIHIQGKTGVVYSVVLRSVGGSDVKQSTLRSEGTLSVTDLPAGLYFLQITTSTQSKIYRLLKQQ